MEILLILIVLILLFLFIYFSLMHKGPDDRKAADRYKQTIELTRQMREFNK